MGKRRIYEVMDYPPYRITIKLSPEPVVAELVSGPYNVHLIGGFSVEGHEGFGITITNVKTGERIKVNEPFFKKRDYSYGRSINYFNFSINENEKFEIVVHDFEKLVVKRSMNPLFNILQERVPSDKLKILIVRE